MPRGSKEERSCSTTSTNQYSSPHQSDQRETEPLNRVGQMRAVVQRWRRPAAGQRPGFRFLELNDERQKPGRLDVATAARRHKRNPFDSDVFRLAVGGVIDVKRVGRR